MEIIIEVGNLSQQELIKQELFLIVDVVQRSVPPLNLSQICIPQNFEAKVNELQGTTNYKENRGIGSQNLTAMAKIIPMGESIAIVLSPRLYTENEDSQTRTFVYIHELAHVLNRQTLPKLPKETYVKDIYNRILYSMYDEYFADRFAYQIIDTSFDKKGQLWVKKLESDLEGFITLINDPQYYETIRAEIESFRAHENVKLFLDTIEPSFDQVSLSIVHAFSNLDHYPNPDVLEELLKSRFVNEKTLALMKYIKAMYEGNEMNLLDGFDLVVDYCTNFGFELEHRDYGGYCYVLDI